MPSRSDKVGTVKAVFIDRDGTINVERDFVHRVEDWEFKDQPDVSVHGFKPSNCRDDTIWACWIGGVRLPV